MKTIRTLTTAIILSGLLTLSMPLRTWANCIQSAAYDAPTLFYDATSVLNASGAVSLVEKTNYPGTFKCSIPAWGIIGGKNTVSNVTPYSSNTLYLKFPGDAYVSLNVSGLAPQETHPRVGTSTASILNASFIINLKLIKTIPTKNVMVVDGDIATIDPIVLAQDSTGLTLLQSVARLVADFAYFVFNWRWPKHNYDLYYQPLQIRFVKSVTTCSFDDANKTVVLNNIDISSLAGGATSGKKEFSLNFSCANFEGNGTTTRNVLAYMSSNHLLISDSSTLMSPSAGSAGGVGIRLAKASDSIPLVLSPSANAQGNATPLFSYTAHQTMPPRLSIPMTAWYYVYDKQALSSGPVKTTAVVNFVYD